MINSIRFAAKKGGLVPVYSALFQRHFSVSSNVKKNPNVAMVYTYFISNLSTIWNELILIVNIDSERLGCLRRLGDTRDHIGHDPPEQAPGPGELLCAQHQSTPCDQSRHRRSTTRE
jgi:hypothetical protein